MEVAMSLQPLMCETFFSQKSVWPESLEKCSEDHSFLLAHKDLAFASTASYLRQLDLGEFLIFF